MTAARMIFSSISNEMCEKSLEKVVIDGRCRVDLRFCGKKHVWFNGLKVFFGMASRLEWHPQLHLFVKIRNEEMLGFGWVLLSFEGGLHHFCSIKKKIERGFVR